MPELPLEPDAHASEPGRLDAARLAGLYVAHAEELRRFLRGVLRDGHLADDALQAAFAKAAEQGHTVQEESLKGWLFRVAMNEALLVRRRQQVHRIAIESRGIRLQGEASHAVGDRGVDSPDARLIRLETIRGIRRALDELPPAQRTVVDKRIHEDKTFAEIARELGIPLGTALTRMQAALKKLREKLLDL